jgi:hypothetical protein
MLNGGRSGAPVSDKQPGSGNHELDKCDLPEETALKDTWVASRRETGGHEPGGTGVDMARGLVAMCMIAGTAMLSQPQAATKLACIGTSITYQGRYTEPLAQALGSGYALSNFGINGTTLFADCTCWLGIPSMPRTSSPNITDVIDLQPDIITIELGANDGFQWGQRGSCYKVLDAEVEFIRDYNVLLDSLVHNITPKPRILICLATPDFYDAAAGLLVRDSINPTIRKVGVARNLTVIDNYTPCANHPEYFGDGLHPNAAGGQVMATAMYNAITATTAMAPAVRGSALAAAQTRASPSLSCDVRGRLVRATAARSAHDRLLVRKGPILIHE